MGLNFGMVLGAMAGQIGLIFVTDWGVTGVSGLALAAIVSSLIAVLLGYITETILNRAKGREMVTGFILAFFIKFRRTKIGQDMRAVRQDMAVADSARIPVERTRIAAIIISTVLSCYGQIIYLQNIGTLNTYNSHDQVPCLESTSGSSSATA